MIRLKTLAWIEENGELFVVRNHDSVKGDDYYRPIGGSVNFGERTVDALRREVQEELGTTISITGEPLIIENIFTCDGKAGHEIDYLFPHSLIRPSFMSDGSLTLLRKAGSALMPCGSASMTAWRGSTAWCRRNCWRGTGAERSSDRRVKKKQGFSKID